MMQEEILFLNFFMGGVEACSEDVFDAVGLVVGDAVCFVGGSHVDHAGIVFLVGVWVGVKGGS